MSKTKSPFVSFTLEEVERAEATCFVVRIGKEFYNKDGNFVFSLKEAERHYNILLKNIVLTLEEGTSKQKKAALSCLETLKIEPLRLQ